MLGSDMEHLEGSCKKVGFLLKEKPHQAVAFKCEAIGAKRIFARDAAIGKKFLVRMRADWAGYVLALVELGEYLHRQRAYCLEDRPWDVANDKADDGFHRTR